MRHWWQQLQPRERRIILIGGGIAVLLLFYELIWSPFTDHLQRYRQQVSSQKQLLQWMQVSTRKIAELKARGYSRKTLGDQSLLAVVDASITRDHLSIFATKIAETQGDQVNVVFDAVPFDQMLTWLEEIWRTYGIASTQISATPKKTPGLVQAQLTLALK